MMFEYNYLLKHACYRVSAGVSISRKKLLPPGLFEKILHKSKEFRWVIHQNHLLHLLSYRDVLQWNSLLHRKHEILSDDGIFGLMNQVTSPIKALSIVVDNLSEEGMTNLCKMGSTIESLELTYKTRLDSQIIIFSSNHN